MWLEEKASIGTSKPRKINLKKKSLKLLAMMSKNLYRQQILFVDLLPMTRIVDNNSRMYLI
jgi:phosphorylcholine metabolism protein LicD